MTSASAPSAASVQPARAGDEEHGRERGAVDERGAEVRLDEDEPDRKRGEPERASVVVRGSSMRFARSARKPASARTKSSLPNSDGWKRNEPTSSQRCEPRVTGPATKTSSIVADGADVDRAPEPLEVRGLRRARRRSRPAPAADEGRLADEEVVRAAVDVVVRDPVDRPEPVADERGDGAREHPVEAAQERELVQARGAPRPRAGALGRRILRSRSPSVARQSDRAPSAGAFSWKNCSNTFSAAGAATVPPWPPFSISAQTTSVGLSYGP